MGSGISSTVPTPFQIDKEDLYIPVSEDSRHENKIETLSSVDCGQIEKDRFIGTTQSDEDDQRKLLVPLTGTTTTTTAVAATATAASVFDRDIDVLPPIRLINFNDFEKCGTFPRYPENKDITKPLDDVLSHRDQSLIIFISHCWLRGYPGAEGYDGRPHPDNKNGDKFRLIVDGIKKVKKALARDMKYCYVWLDFGCMDQDGNPAGELKQLDKIVQSCDCIFTPIYDPDWQSWELNIFDVYKDYKAKLWSEGDFSYVQRAWCRVEMFYASNIPLLTNTENRLHCFHAGLRLHARNGVRPHILYGDKEYNELKQPMLLPPLQNSYYEKLNPIHGKLSVPSDMIHIERLIKILEPYKKIHKVGYEGDYNIDGLPHGKGIFRYADGDLYDGEYKNGKKHGKGIYTNANGDIYDGEYCNGKKHGKGVYKCANGNVYDGEYKDDNMHGHGIHTFADGDIYDGEWMNGMMHGKGIYKHASGSFYDGEWKDHKKHGKGIYNYADGNVYDGEWKDGMMDGKGVYQHASGCSYNGEWKDHMKHGKGIYKYDNGNVYNGEYQYGNKHGKGIFTYANGNIYDGEWKNNKKNGKGVFKYASGDEYKGEYKDDKMHGKGIYKYADGSVNDGEWKDGKKL